MQYRKEWTCWAECAECATLNYVYICMDGCISGSYQNTKSNRTERDQTKRNLINIHYRWSFYCKYCQSWSERVLRGSEMKATVAAAGKSSRRKREREILCFLTRYVLGYKINALISISHIHRWIIPQFQSQKYQVEHTHIQTVCDEQKQNFFKEFWYILVFFKFFPLIYRGASIIVCHNTEIQIYAAAAAAIWYRLLFQIPAPLAFQFRWPPYFLNSQFPAQQIFHSVGIKRKCVYFHFYFYFITYTNIIIEWTLSKSINRFPFLFCFKVYRTNFQVSIRDDTSKRWYNNNNHKYVGNNFCFSLLLFLFLFFW